MMYSRKVDWDLSCLLLLRSVCAIIWLGVTLPIEYGPNYLFTFLVPGRCFDILILCTSTWSLSSNSVIMLRRLEES